MAKLIDITGKALSGEWGNDDETGEGVPVLRTANFTNEGIINYDNVVTRIISKKNIDEKYLQKGDIIIEKSGGSDKVPVGRVVYFEGDEKTYLFNNFTGLLRVKNQDVWYPKYVFYSLFANYRQGGTRAFENKTTGLHNLKTDDYVTRYEVHELDKYEQVLICEKLDKLYDVINCRKQELQLLDELIKARFVEMFGDPIINEKDWPTKPLLDMGQCKNGMNFHYDDEGVEINCLGVGDFKDFSVINNTDELPKISLKEMPSEEYLLKDDDIVFVRSNGNKALVGRSIAVYPGDIPTTFSGFCIRYRKHDNEITVPYLLRVLKADSMRVKMTGRGANIQNLNQQILRTLVIPVPPIELQNQFADFVKQVDKSKVAVQKALDETQLLFDSLMQKYFG